MCIAFKSVKICLKISKTNQNKDIYKLSEIIPQYSKFAFFVMVFSLWKCVLFVFSIQPGSLSPPWDDFQALGNVAFTGWKWILTVRLTHCLEIKGNHLAACIPEELRHIVGWIHACSLWVYPAKLHFVISGPSC